MVLYRHIYQAVHDATTIVHSVYYTHIQCSRTYLYESFLEFYFILYFLFYNFIFFLNFYFTSICYYFNIITSTTSLPEFASYHFNILHIRQIFVLLLFPTKPFQARRNIREFVPKTCFLLSNLNRRTVPTVQVYAIALLLALSAVY